MDLILGVIIFMLAIGVVYTLLGDQTAKNVAPLRIESEVIATKLTSDASLQGGSGTLKIAASNQIDAASLGYLAAQSQSDYEGLKKELGVQNEFCIYLRDEQGNVTYITDPATGKRYAGIGSGTGDVNITCLTCPAGTPGTPGGLDCSSGCSWPCGKEIPPLCVSC